MRPEDIRRFLTEQPFRSFRLFVLESTSYEIRHPELVMLGRTTLTIDLSNPHDPFPLANHSVTIALLHVTRIEPIFSAAVSSGNGQ